MVSQASFAAEEELVFKGDEASRYEQELGGLRAKQEDELRVAGLQASDAIQLALPRNRADNILASGRPSRR